MSVRGCYFGLPKINITTYLGTRPVNINDIVLSPLTKSILSELGRLDAKRFFETKEHDQYSSWKQCAEESGFDPNGRTPAKEAYLDGWYSFFKS